VADALRRGRVAARYVLGHLRHRDPRTWVFGSVKGFADNSRYLAEHVAHAHPQIEAWWIARSDAEAGAARAAGLRVARRGSPEAHDVQSRARVAFLSSGFQDVEAAYLGGAFVVDVRHGMPNKKILLDMDDPGLRASSWRRRMVARLRRWLVARRLGQVDLVIAQGELGKERFKTAFAAPERKVVALGTPRFDVILGAEALDRVGGRDLRQRLGLPADAYVVLWLPTWRDEGDAGWLPALDADALDRHLAGTPALLAIKPHPYADQAVFRGRLPEHPRIRLLDQRDVDPNALLRVGDALLTDYSSAASDYALLDRPIHFFAPDLAAYRGGLGLYEPYEAFTGGTYHETWQSLLPALAASARGDDRQARDAARRIRQRQRDRDEPGSSERIVRAVAERIGLELEPAAERSGPTLTLNSGE
jgi:CDP-glycerol glycerophosphotransferase